MQFKTERWIRLALLGLLPGPLFRRVCSWSFCSSATTLTTLLTEARQRGQILGSSDLISRNWSLGSRSRSLPCCERQKERLVEPSRLSGSLTTQNIQF